ncbi:tRNA uridine-5-carboxymethylaminomethyl(34) synthesis GTPase MnmE [Marinilongibacter aquaticus]|uniref:tRNA uridine-5-carboxymethylaminomethyl(34) synthesis GTPase MnmE n=1 Tax=Marinilongibacter aquaticus TaxID=2975157 RepID=UPI0021BDCC75|nr:tRNA uridine-5-carboxymethylaminomethyl(34) synthesis GTPase MnmE [Marinilongibacter aquaticus]UBM60105.1 tRNA uridine-5-carboxymethylaminomethyl(34) synthesis GTPase MnmE [Marinilongibacter aquaticus]
MSIIQQEPICALATAPGVGAIAVIRVSGTGAIEIVNRIFKGKNLTKVATHTVHFGQIMQGDTTLDEVLAAVFHSPKSFTKEDTVEISCHGSSYVINTLLKTLMAEGCRLANPGEFTQRAFLNGQFDLVQAEAVADLIEADSAAAHQTAINQLRGGFSHLLGELREQLIHFASLVELELDFGEEDVEFADREDLKALIAQIQAQLFPLIQSFDAGNAIKEGIPVAIIGQPNVGKSTLLNALLKEERAIVSDIAGTTRDAIEDTLVLKGMKFRFIDTAGIRQTDDHVEGIGIKKSKMALEKARLVVLMYENKAERDYLEELLSQTDMNGKHLFWVKNKADISDKAIAPTDILISAKTGLGIQDLEEKLVNVASEKKQGDTVLTNLRHFDLLQKTNAALEEVLNGLNMGITGDFLAQDIRLALHHLGELTGTITTDDLLKNIFGRFCIGK